MTIRFIRMVLLFIAAMACGNVVHAQTVVINPSKDNTLYEEPAGATSNGAGEYMFVGRTNQTSNSIRRGIIAFNLVDRIPPGTTIVSVTLTMNMSKTISGAQTVGLHRVNANWGEGTSDAGGQEGGGAPATTNDATWLHSLFSSTLWSSPGGSFATTASATQSVSALGSYTWGSTAGMVSDVQQWVNNPTSNFGWVIRGNEASGATAKRFDSRQNTTVANRPKLTVTFSTTDVEEDARPREFVLHQNYPNPFNPSTTIEFQLPVRSRTTLKIFNLLGQQVAELVNGTLSAGGHSVQWSAGEMSSGVYVYRLESDGFVATRKLVLAR